MRKKGSVNIENCNYRQQMGGKSGLEKAYQYKKKVDRGDVDTSGAHCISIGTEMT